MIIIPEEIIEYFGRSCIPSRFLITRIEEDNKRVINAVNDLLRQVEVTIADSGLEYQPLIARVKGLLPEQAKFYIASSLIDEALAKKRISILCDVNTGSIKPYDHNDLNGIKVNSDGLVKLKEFDLQSPMHGMGRGSTVFQILPSILSATNSMYWAYDDLVDWNSKAEIYVRLDPLLIQSVTEFRPYIQKMLVYGKPLDWKFISKLKTPIHSRWCPDPGWQDDVEFTDLVWFPCDEGIEFICEEIPKSTTSSFRASRYFHSILNPDTLTFGHCDGAIRIYSDEEISERCHTHVRNIGKIGKRIKIFLVNSDITNNDWTSLVCAFYVWNNDIQNYFGVGIPSLSTE
jgi:hypothetical protein